MLVVVEEGMLVYSGAVDHQPEGEGDEEGGGVRGGLQACADQPEGRVQCHEIYSAVVLLHKSTPCRHRNNIPIEFLLTRLFSSHYPRE